jgi:D-sedoheptulose 7-phosphate isomerase
VAEPAPSRRGAPLQGSEAHLAALAEAIQSLEAQRERVDGWGQWLAERLLGGARLLAVGNGGSAAEAQHLTAELVGRFSTERNPLSAIPLHADGSSLTAIANDYGADQIFARQVEAHGRPGDILFALSTSGRSENVLRAVEAANRLDLTSLAITGPGPNPLTELCDEAVACDAPSAATTQEMHLIAVHLLCGAVDRGVERLERLERSGRNGGAQRAAQRPARRTRLRRVPA